MIMYQKWISKAVRYGKDADRINKADKEDTNVKAGKRNSRQIIRYRTDQVRI